MATVMFFLFRTKLYSECRFKHKVFTQTGVFTRGLATMFQSKNLDNVGMEHAYLQVAKCTITIH